MDNEDETRGGAPQLRTEPETNGDEPCTESFASELNFAPSDMWKDPETRTVAFDMLQAVQDGFESLNVPHCVFFGTLLGAIRHGGPVRNATLAR